MKKALGVILLALIFLVTAVIVGGFFFLNYYYLPVKIVPEISKQVSSTLGKDFSISAVMLTPSGEFTVSGISLKEKDKTLAQCQTVIISPDYGEMYKSWKVNKQTPNLPVKARLKKISFSQPPIEVQGAASADFKIGLNLKDPRQINWQGTVHLDNFTVSSIPAVGSITGISGDIEVSEKEIKSTEIKGLINNAEAVINFSMEDLASPHIIANARFTPLLLSADLSLPDKKNLNINKLDASYNRINLSCTGSVANLSKEASAKISADVKIELSDLSGLPLEIKPQIEALKPSGLLHANLGLNGKLKDPKSVSSTITLSSDSIDISGRAIKNLSINASFGENILNITDLSADIMGTAVQTKATLNFNKEDDPFRAQITLRNADLNKITAGTPVQTSISGIIQSDIDVSGTLNDLSKIDFLLQSKVSDFTYDKYSFKDPWNFNAKFSLLKTKDLQIDNAELSDGTVKTVCRGKISDVSAPSLDLSGQTWVLLDNLSAYSWLSLPENFIIKGTLDSSFSCKGSASDIQNSGVQAQIKSEDIILNQLEFGNLAAEVQYKQKKLSLENISMELYNGILKGKANIDLSGKKNSPFRVSANIRGVDLGIFAKNSGLLSQDFKGILNSDIEADGAGLSPEKMNCNATVKAAIAEAQIKGIPISRADISALCSYENDSLNVSKFNLNYKNISLNAKGKLKSIHHTPVIDMTGETDLNLADLADIPIKTNIDWTQISPKGTVALKIIAQGPINPPSAMDLNADLNSDKVSVKDVVFSGLKATAVLKDKLLHAQVKTESYQGIINFDYYADFLKDNFSYRGSLSINGEDIGAMIKESKIIAQQHEGILGFNLDFTGLGTNASTINGKAHFKLDQAKLSGIETFKSIGSLLGLGFMSDFKVDDASGDFQISDSKVTTDNLLINGPQAIIETKGSIGFNQELDLKTTLYLTDDGAQKTRSGTLENFFVYEDNRYHTEMDIKGTLSAPKPDMHKFLEDRVKQQVKKAAEKTVNNLIKAIFKQ